MSFLEAWATKYQKISYFAIPTIGILKLAQVLYVYHKVDPLVVLGIGLGLPLLLAVVLGFIWGKKTSNVSNWIIRHLGIFLAALAGYTNIIIPFALTIVCVSGAYYLYLKALKVFNVGEERRAKIEAIKVVAPIAGLSGLFCGFL